MQKSFMSFISFVLLILLFSGCYKVNKMEVKKPDNIIPKDKMADILTDMEIIQGAAVYSREHYPQYDEIEKRYYQALFDHYRVTESQIRANLDYYNNQGTEMADIYDKVMSKLTEKQTILTEKQKIEEGKKSLKKDTGNNFPFLFRINNFGNLCFNPAI